MSCVSKNLRAQNSETFTCLRLSPAANNNATSANGFSSSVSGDNDPKFEIVLLQRPENGAGEWASAQAATENAVAHFEKASTTHQSVKQKTNSEKDAPQISMLSAALKIAEKGYPVFP